jgi:Xaa-Pro aminopeptidase
MPQTSTHRREAVGEIFTLEGMLAARALTFDAVYRIAAAVQPGMTEGRAHQVAEDILAGMGMQRIWHKTIVRFGEGTLSSFHEPVGSERMLQETDIFFVDLGVVWDGHEGDAGDTFAVGSDPEMAACAAAARTLWAEVSAKWEQDGLTGQALYEFAERRAHAAGWVLKRDVKGHRVSDFPHAIYRAGDLGDFDARPSSGLWVLEIHLEHPTRPFGAFYEDLLIEPESAANP